MFESILLAVKTAKYWIIAGSGAIVGGLVAGSVAYWIGHAKGDTQGYARYAAEQAVHDHRIEQERKENDIAIQSQSDYDACVSSLERRGLPIDACEQLRGIHP